jgi:hypothetical protein
MPCRVLIVALAPGRVQDNATLAAIEVGLRGLRGFGILIPQTAGFSEGHPLGSLAIDHRDHVIIGACVASRRPWGRQCRVVVVINHLAADTR